MLRDTALTSDINGNQRAKVLVSSAIRQLSKGEPFVWVSYAVQALRVIL